MTILISVIIGLFAGFTIGFFICLKFKRTRTYSGIIKIIPDEGKLIYSLELDENPIMLQHMNEVVFKVETSDESSNRK